MLRGSITARNDAATSALVNGAPSCQRTFRRRWYVTVRPSAEMPPFARVGTTAASAGTARPVRSQAISGSWISRRISLSGIDCESRGKRLCGSVAIASRSARPPAPPPLARCAHAASAQTASKHAASTISAAAGARRIALIGLAEQRPHVAQPAVQVVDAVHPGRLGRALEPVVEPLVEVHRPVLLLLATAQVVVLAVEREQV